MKKRNGKQKQRQKGFTLIELLAVITIMGILMLVAIPAVSRVIENSRKDTLANTASAYLNAVKNSYLTGELVCGGSESIGDGNYYFNIDTSVTSSGTEGYVGDLMESVAKSSWGNADLKGYVKIVVTEGKATYYVKMGDSSLHGICAATATNGVTNCEYDSYSKNLVSEDQIKGSSKRSYVHTKIKKAIKLADSSTCKVKTN